MISRQASSILNLLARGPVAALELAQALNIHQTNVSRTLKPLQQSGQVVRLLGRTRGAR